jgi:hypothetical protein
MKYENFVLKTKNKTSQKEDHSNYKILSEALRRDMRAAVERLLPIHAELGNTKLAGLPLGMARKLADWLEAIDAALTDLDCLDHIPIPEEIVEGGEDV